MTLALLLALLVLALVAGTSGHAALHAGDAAGLEGGHCTACHFTPFEVDHDAPRARAADLVGVAPAVPHRGPLRLALQRRAAPRAPPRVG